MPTISYLNPATAALFDSAWECYRAGYAGPPWNEWKKCESCGRSFGLEIGDNTDCTNCQTTLVDYWPKAQIAADIMGSLKRYEGVCITAQHEGEVVGLTVGYNIPTADLRRELELSSFSAAYPRVTYQDEIVVRPDWQGKGIGRALYMAWHGWAKLHGERFLFARTLSDPPTVVYSWYQRLGYGRGFDYPEPDKRVILRFDTQDWWRLGDNWHGTIT